MHLCILLHMPSQPHIIVLIIVHLENSMSIYFLKPLLVSSRLTTVQAFYPSLHYAFGKLYKALLNFIHIHITLATGV